jgi:2-C-methyl-D-erythritol 4-phosphate cytidylyltransferase
MELMKYTALIVAAGSGTRMKLGYNKVYALMRDGRTILNHTMDIFRADKDCIQIVVVTEALTFYQNMEGSWPGMITIAKGGKTRQESVKNGLQAVLADYVMVHDGARPYLDEKSLKRIKKALKENDAVLLSVPCKDTIKKIDEDGYIEMTYDRSTLCAAQTPQAFRTELLTECMCRAEEAGFTGTDDCSLVEAFSDTRVKTVEGSYANIKITTPEDM